MFNHLAPSLSSQNEDTTSQTMDFGDLFKTETSSVLVEEDSFQKKPQIPPNEGLPNLALEKNENGNKNVTRRVNNQVVPRAVNRISKEMKKCSREYFQRAFAKNKKQVLFVAKQVSF